MTEVRDDPAYNVWLEGYCDTGTSAAPDFFGSTAEYFGRHYATSFKSACVLALKNVCRYSTQDYNEETNTVCGRRFFDNEEDARELSG